MCKYDIKTVLELKNEKSSKEYFSVDDVVEMIYEDFNDGEIEVKGKIVGIEDDGYLLIYNFKSLNSEYYYLSNVKYIVRNN